MPPIQKSRREVLEQFVAEKPGDAFARYGLALECTKSGDDTAATGHFEKLLENNPAYVAGYFQFGSIFRESVKPNERVSCCPMAFWWRRTQATCTPATRCRLCCR